MDVNIFSSSVLLAFGLTLFAGLSTGIGAAIAFFARRTNYRLLAFSLAFSAGVMLFISFVEILGKGQSSLSQVYGEKMGALWAYTAFFAGLGVIMVIDRFVPKVENPHEMPTQLVAEIFETQKTQSEAEIRASNAARLLRMGKFAALAIAIHNFPEGLVSFFTALEDPKLGVAIAVAIALHNIPEGVSVSIPIFYATGSRWKAFWYSMLSGVAEPVGALLGFFLLRPYFGPTLSGVLFALVAGIMVFISLDELLPAAREHAKGHETVYGIAAGMAIMAASLVLFK